MTAKRQHDDDYIKHYFEYGLCIPNRTIYCDYEVDEVMTEYVIKSLNILEASEGEIRLILNNVGGECYDGMAIYDYIRQVASSHDVYIDVYGSCMSMATWILQAATHRRLAPNARLMIHVGYTGHEHNHPEIVQRWVDRERADEKIYERILYERIRSQHPRYSIDKLRKVMRFDTIYTANEAVALGLADTIIM